jgi:3-oxoacyl-[acyl-carrier protein] reductase
MKIDLSGKIALVTGASRGIGEAIARRLGETGATVLCAARTAARVEEVANAIVAAGGRAKAVELDIAGADLRERIKALIEENERIDILVNNAGVTADDLFIRMKPEAWDTVMSTNLDAMFHLTQEVVKKMIRTKWGRVINISSVVGLSGNPGQVNYAASKAGIIGFTKALALEIGSRNVTVNAVAPGFILTAMTEAMTAEAKGAMEGKIALRRLGTPDDVAWAVTFLASEEAAYITGHVLNVSGGLYL